MDKRKRRLLCMLEGGKKYKWIRGAPPLSFRALAAGELKNYRIYGNTVGGESVGDRTGNLFDKNSPEIQNGVYVDNSGTFINSVYHQLSPYITCIANYTYRLYMERASSNVFTVYVNLWDSNKQFIKNIYVAQLPREYQTLSMSFIPSENGFITFNFLNNADITKNVMFYKSSTALPYEPYGYKVPVTVSNGTDTLTTPIYLPEPIKMVGDEAEYIDYAEQKMHRIGADDVDVTLPALPTLTGTNVLSVGTAVQPSEIEVKGKIKAI